MKLIITKTFRIGKQSLWYDEEKKQYYVSIVNRTYQSTQPIPLAKVDTWRELLKYNKS